MMRLGLILVVLVAFLNWDVSTQANAIHLDAMLQSGYDELGRSIAWRLVAGLQVALSVALWVVLFSALIGVSVGLLSGYLGGWLDHVLMRIVDVFLAFPGLLLAIVLAGVLGPGLNNVILALVVVGWVGFARITRAQTLSVKQSLHIEAARAMAISTPVILWRHILPLIRLPLLVEATFGFAAAVLSEAGLSFLGLGIQPPEASWGQMIREGARYLLVAPHLVIWPSLALFIFIYGVNSWAEYLRRRWDIYDQNQR